MTDQLHKTIEPQGLELKCSKAKEGSLFPNDLAVLTLPGICCNASMYNDFSNSLAGSGITSYAVSYRGTGRSRWTPFTKFSRLSQLSEDVNLAVEHLKNQGKSELILVGHSLGARVMHTYLSQAKEKSILAGIGVAGIPVRGVLAANLRCLLKFPSTYLATTASMNVLTAFNDKIIRQELLFSNDPEQPVDIEFNNGSFIANLEASFKLNEQNINRIKMSTTALLTLAAKNESLFTEEEVMSSVNALGHDSNLSTDIIPGPHMGITMSKYAPLYASRIIKLIKNFL